MGKMSRLRRVLYSFAEAPSLIHVRRGSPLSVAFTKIGQGLQLSEDDILGAFNLDESAAESVAKFLATPQIIPAGPGKAVALVRAYGIANYEMEYQPYCFSTLELAQTYRALANDPEIGTIVTDFNSPGGLVTGTLEAADALFAARKKKNCIALVNPLCASAAYWIASQASEIIAVPSADIGSVGVFVLHVDLSAALEMAGVKPTFIFAGKYKIEGNPFEPLGPEATAYLQGEVDKTYAKFIAAVARGRGQDPAYVEANFGQGRTMSTDDAKRVKMIDRVAALEVAMQRCGVTMDMMDSRRGRRGESAGDVEAAKGKNTLNKKGESFGNSLIANGDVDRKTAWSFSADDENALLGPKGDDWANYGKHHLGEDASQADDTKAHWKYPFAKGGKVYRSGLTAIRQRAGQQGDADILDAAGRMMEKCDKAKGASAGYAEALDQGFLTQEEVRQVEDILHPDRSAEMAALMEGCEKVLFRVDQDGESQKVYAESAWPKKMQFTRGLLQNWEASLLVVNDDTVTMTPANGKATYKKIGEHLSGDWICVLQDGSTYEPMPAQAAPDLAEQAQSGLDHLAAANAAVEATAARARRLALLRA